jgi:phage terminase small subunit
MSNPAPQPTPPLTSQARYEAALAALPAQRRKLVREYLRDLNGTRAAIRAGYAPASAASQASEILRSPKVAAAIDAGLDLQAMPANEILARLSTQARGDISDYLRVDEEDVTLTWSLISAPLDPESGEVDVGGLVMKLATQDAVTPTDRILHTATVKRSVARLDLLEAGQRGKLGVVKKYTVDKDGKESIELYSAKDALELLGKHRKLWGDDPAGGIMKYLDVARLTPDQLERLSAGEDPYAVLLGK